MYLCLRSGGSGGPFTSSRISAGALRRPDPAAPGRSGDVKPSGAAARSSPPPLGLSLVLKPGAEADVRQADGLYDDAALTRSDGCVAAGGRTVSPAAGRLLRWQQIAIDGGPGLNYKSSLARLPFSIFISTASPSEAPLQAIYGALFLGKLIR